MGKWGRRKGLVRILPEVQDECGGERMKEWFAGTRWHPDDVLALRPEWTKQKAMEFLTDCEKHIRDRSIEFGWDAINALLVGWENERDD